MKHEIIAANILLSGTNISILDAARLIKNILDAKDEKSSLNALEFCNKIIDIGKRHILKTEMSIKDGFLLYL